MSNKFVPKNRELQELFDHRRVLDKIHLQYIRGEQHNIKLINTIVPRRSGISDEITRETQDDAINSSKNFGDTFNSLSYPLKTPKTRNKNQYKKLPISTNYMKFRRYAGRMALIDRKIRTRSLVSKRGASSKGEEQIVFLSIRNSIG